MVDDIGATKWQPECEADMDQWSHTPTEVHQRNAADTDPPRHKSRIEQWTADGCIVVIGHCCQDTALSISKQPKENICSAQPEREMLFLDAKKFASILGRIAVEQLMSKKDKLLRK